MMGQAWWAWVIRVFFLGYWLVLGVEAIEEHKRWKAAGCLFLALAQFGVILLNIIEIGG